MASNPLYIVLCSGEHEKVQMAAMMASVGAVSERPVLAFGEKLPRGVTGV
jgi:peroxiredoxin family protein